MNKAMNAPTIRTEIEAIVAKAAYGFEWIFPTVIGAVSVDREKQDIIKAEALDAIMSKFDELIGEDEQTTEDSKNHNYFRNKLRAEMRLKAGLEEK